MKKLKEILDSIDRRLLKLEVHFENHIKHHRHVIVPFLIAAIILLLALHIRGG